MLAADRRLHRGAAERCDVYPGAVDDRESGIMAVEGEEQIGAGQDHGLGRLGVDQVPADGEEQRALFVVELLPWP